MTNCKTAKRLTSKWANEMQHANMNNWQRIMFGKREIDAHRKKCKRCKNENNK